MIQFYWFELHYLIIKNKKTTKLEKSIYNSAIYIIKWYLNDNSFIKKKLAMINNIVKEQEMILESQGLKSWKK